VFDLVFAIFANKWYQSLARDSIEKNWGSNLSVSPMKKPLPVSFPGGDMKTSHPCPQVNLKIMGLDFPSNLVVLKSWGIDVILGMGWLRKYDGVM
jgi:hypothetical protein